VSVRNDAQRHKHSINASSAELRFAKVPMNLGVTAVMLPELDFPEQISLCRELGITCYQFRPRYIPPEHRNQPYSNWGNHKFDLTPQRLLDEGPVLHELLDRAGLKPHGTLPAVTIDAPDDTLLLHLRGAQSSGAGRIRCQPPAYPPTIFDYPPYLDATIARYRDVITRLARPLGIKLLIETHNQSSAASPSLAWNIVRHFSPTDLSVIFDIANFNLEGELRPSLAVSILKPWIDCIHIGGFRRTFPARDHFGCRTIGREACALTDCDLHIPTWIAALREAKIDAPLIIEDYDETLSGAERLRRCATLLTRLLNH
jgi:sugar phosphate isomerase/epimerase